MVKKYKGSASHERRVSARCLQGRLSRFQCLPVRPYSGEPTIIAPLHSVLSFVQR